MAEIVDYFYIIPTTVIIEEDRLEEYLLEKGDDVISYQPYTNSDINSDYSDAIEEDEDEEDEGDGT